MTLTMAKHLIILNFFPKHSTNANAYIHARTLNLMNTRTQPYHISTSKRLSQQWRSHHGRLAIDRHVAYRKMRALVPSLGLEPRWVGSTTRNLTSWATLSLLIILICCYMRMISVVVNILINKIKEIEKRTYMIGKPHTHLSLLQSSACNFSEFTNSTLTVLTTLHDSYI
jgi:hypothetical protein